MYHKSKQILFNHYYLMYVTGYDHPLYYEAFHALRNYQLSCIH